MLLRYLSSDECTYKLPADIESYIDCTDDSLYEHLKTPSNFWAKKIAQRRPFVRVFEHHSIEASERCENLKKELEDQSVKVIFSSSTARLSKYHSMSEAEKKYQIFVVDEQDPWSETYPIEECTEVFQKYEDIRNIERLYVDSADVEKANKLIGKARN